MTALHETLAELAAVRPHALTAYLNAHGWRRVDVADFGERWTPPSGRGWAHVLLDSTFDDYPSRVADVIRLIAHEERRSADSVLGDLQPDDDIQRIRLFPESRSGTIPLPDAMLAHEGLREAVNCAIYLAMTPEPARVLPGRKPQEVYTKARDVLLGPPESGSYVLTVRTPLDLGGGGMGQLDLLDQQYEQDTDSEPFGRKVTAAFREGVTSAFQAAQADRVHAFTTLSAAGPGPGLTANLCEALYGIGANGKMAFEMSFAWAGRKPVAEPTPPLVFSRETLSQLNQLALRMRQEFAQPDATLYGVVVGLDREPGRGLGEITVNGKLEDDPSPRMRKFRLKLQSEHYHKAIEAHRRNATIYARGTLEFHNKTLHMVQVRDFVLQVDNQ